MVEVFIDSSVLIEGLKGNPKAVKILNYLADGGAVAIINDIVVSEFLFHFSSESFALQGGGRSESKALERYPSL